METIFEIKKMKEDIKKLSEEQRFLRNQRKTVRLVGERKMEPREATWKHQANRENLRIMFAAYGLMRGKPFTKTEENAKWEKKYLDSTFDECHPLNKHKEHIDKMLEKYIVEVPAIME